LLLVVSLENLLTGDFILKKVCDFVIRSLREVDILAKKFKFYFSISIDKIKMRKDIYI